MPATCAVSKYRNGVSTRVLRANGCKPFAEARVCAAVPEAGEKTNRWQGRKYDEQ